MATLTTLVAGGSLVRYEADLDCDEQPARYVYLAREVDAWFSCGLPKSSMDRDRQITPYEQVEQALYEFVVGRPLTYGYHYHPLNPIGHYVWELRTADVRLIGWFVRKATFLIVCGRLKRELLKPKLYTPCVQQSLWFRNNLDLDVPKAITGASRHDVL